MMPLGLAVLNDIHAVLPQHLCADHRKCVHQLLQQRADALREMHGSGCLLLLIVIEQRAVVHHCREIRLKQVEEFSGCLHASAGRDAEQAALCAEVRDCGGVRRKQGLLRRQQCAVEVGEQCKPFIGQIL